jgi:hypothetical protein
VTVSRCGLRLISLLTSVFGAPTLRPPTSRVNAGEFREKPFLRRGSQFSRGGGLAPEHDAPAYY